MRNHDPSLTMVWEIPDPLTTIVSLGSTSPQNQIKYFEKKDEKNKLIVLRKYFLKILIEEITFFKFEGTLFSKNAQGDQETPLI